ncbi:MAG: glycine cleavage system protein GcvH [Desulfarculaceae bacterium]|jgi:glycine cleavage system H protein
MEFPPDLKYGADHLWIRELEDGKVTLGVTDFAQDQLGKVVFVELPAVGDALQAGSEMGAVESAKSVSDLISPVSGEVVQVNESLEDEPATINQDPYGKGWLVQVRLEGGLPAELLSAEEYQKQAG